MCCQDKISAFNKKALLKLFEAVGATYSEEFVKKPDWFLLNSWTAEQERLYGDWFIKELRKDLKLSKKAALKEFQWFCLDYGWTSKENKEGAAK